MSSVGNLTKILEMHFYWYGNTVRIVTLEKIMEKFNLKLINLLEDILICLCYLLLRLCLLLLFLINWKNIKRIRD